MVVGCELAYRQARRAGLETEVIVRGSLWALGAGFFLSHLTSLILYFPGTVKENPLAMLMIWQGHSSFGGFFGGVLGGLLYLRRRGIQPIPYLEAGFFGFVPAWIIARTGCTIAFDHPGRATDFFLGMADGAGVVRHNLGLYEMLFSVLLAAALYGLRNARPFEGFHLALVILLYSPVRFLLDTLRVEDRRYWGLTPGQYFSVLLLALGIWLLLRGRRTRGVYPNAGFTGER